MGVLLKTEEQVGSPVFPDPSDRDFVGTYPYHLFRGACTPNPTVFMETQQLFAPQKSDHV